MNKIIRKVLTVLILSIELAVLSGCKYFSFSKNVETLPYKRLSDTTFSIKPRTNYELTYYDIERLNHNYIKSTGDINILVVPILIREFENDYDINKVISDLNELYFIGQNSVKSFYYESSYHKLNINGRVKEEPIYYSYNDFLRNKDVMIDDLLEYISDTELVEFDNDNNGRIDYISYIYLAPFRENSVYWASTYNTDSMFIDNYSFISVDFLYEDNELSINTLAHELGHAFGLDDYYNGSSNTYDPVGRLDLMSDIFFDNNSFSKMALGWMKPLTISDKKEYTLYPLSTNGSALLIGNDYNSNPFSEYILIEYICGGVYKGLRVYHIDARLALINDDGVKVLNSYNGESGVVVAHSNNPTNSPLYHTNKNEEAYIPLIELIDRRKRSHLKYDYDLTQESLFVLGDVIELKNIKFYSGKGINFNIKVTELTNNYVIISIEE